MKVTAPLGNLTKCPPGSEVGLNFLFYRPSV